MVSSQTSYELLYAAQKAIHMIELYHRVLRAQQASDDSWFESHASSVSKDSPTVAEIKKRTKVTIQQLCEEVKENKNQSFIKISKLN
mmetsp:Transcript_3770/g.4603  ORF Transcript_3770/g.4603 Transcript_3770/m.4603 type:complete len:87 (+) Transcript_3770:312-572(+)